MGTAGPALDPESLRNRISMRLLRKSLDMHPGVETQPIVGVGFSEVENRKGNLEILTTAGREQVLIEELLRGSDLGDFGEVRTNVRQTGLLVPCARPAQGGDSIGNAQGGTGTLGCLVRDNPPLSRRYALSCNHVLARLNEGRRTEDVIVQPGKDDGGGANDQIGHLMLYKDIDFSPAGTNRMDAALCEPRMQADIVSGCRTIGPLSGTEANPEFGTRVRKEGWKTKVTQGTLQIKNLSIRMAYAEGKNAIFDGQYGIIGIHSDHFAAQGDSGSIVLNDAGKAVGLLFGISAGIDLAFVSPIEPILAEFGVQLV